jgi:glycosyltransferase involved in cell wall biosynthesis
MRILHVYKAYYPVLGGIENHVKLVAEGQAAAGHDVTVLATAPGTRTEIETQAGVRIIKAGRIAEVASTPLSLGLPGHLYRQRPDITHLHFPYPPAEAAQAPLLGRRPTVLSYHSDIVRQKRLLVMYQPLMQHVLSRVDRILVSSPAYLASSPVLARVSERCTVLPYGIEQERFRSASPQQVAAIRDRYGPGPLVLFVGVLRYYKGLRYLLEAMQHVAARLILVGDGPEGVALRAQAEALGLTDRVFFAGQVNDDALPAYYQAADIFCLPASERSEAFGLVQVEALSAGLPIVSTELGTGTSYVNRHGKSGLVVPPRDAESLTRALVRMVQDDELRHTLAAGARERAEAFTAARMLRDIEAVYAEVLAH